MIEQKQPKILYNEETDYLLNTNIKPDNQYRQDYDQSKSFAAKTGDFFIFPANLKHGVYPFTVDVQRVSMSFNLIDVEVQ